MALNQPMQCKKFFAIKVFSISATCKCGVKAKKRLVRPLKNGRLTADHKHKLKSLVKSKFAQA